MMRWALVILALAVPAQGWAGRYVVENGSKITFIANHPTHVVHGESIRVSGELFYDIENPEDFHGVIGRAVQAAWLSFDSGNANRDSNMRAAVNAGKYPNLTFVPTELTEVKRTEAELSGTLHGRLYINGVRREVTAPVVIQISDPKKLRVRADLTIKMTDYKIDPPSLLFVKTDDAVKIIVDLIYLPAEPAR